MAKYLACGNIMSDAIKSSDGTMSSFYMGGPAFFALQGIRLFTKDCKLVSRVGADYRDSYGKWMDLHGITQESVKVFADHCTRHIIEHHADGDYSSTSYFGSENMGFLKTHPDEVDSAVSSETRGIYFAHSQEKVIWKKLGDIKEKHGYKMMWELEPRVIKEDLEKVMQVISIPEMFSLNSIEASTLWGIPRDNDEDIINELMKLPVEMTLYRVGKRGAYAVTPSTAEFCPMIDISESVDPTGCGNTSTGAAMWAHTEGYDPRMVVIIANIAAGYNALQKGVYPHITDEVMADAVRLAERKCAEIFCG
ncbi:MAG: carbohydrate kinase family protein [Ruminococcaceae bacterium]|nr:carbohydrate kinase family protein [Oscillospiraceae bacterium]